MTRAPGLATLLGLGLILATGCDEGNGPQGPTVDPTEIPPFSTCVPGLFQGGTEVFFGFTADLEQGSSDNATYGWVDSDVPELVTKQFELVTWGIHGGLTQAGEFQFGLEDEIFKWCRVCVRVFDYTSGEEQIYMPVKDLSDVTFDYLLAGDQGLGTWMAGEMDLVLQEVHIYPSSNFTMPIEGGCKGRLTREFGGSLVEFPGG